MQVFDPIIGDIIGTELADNLTGTAYGEVIVGLGGNDRITSGPKVAPLTDHDGDEDVVHAGDGNDYVVAGFGDDTLYGGNGNDRIYGQSGDDYYEGGFGNDILSESNLDGGDDTMYGGEGNDALYGGNDSDQLFGEGGNDRLDAGIDSVWHRDYTIGYNLLDGGEGNDTLVAGNGYDTLIGGNGDDRLIETAWGDRSPYETRHYAGPGDDYIFLREGNDYIEPGSGNNTVVLGPTRRNHGVKEIVLESGSQNTIEFGDPKTQFADISGLGWIEQIIVPNGWSTSSEFSGSKEIVSAIDRFGDSYTIAEIEITFTILPI